MKIDRLIGILSILLQREKVTAPYLAEKFEVSRRTINRDIEDICMAGIPLVTTPGKNGGISVMEGYRLDRTLLTAADMQDLLAGLKSLDSVSDSNRYQQLMDKLSAGSSDNIAAGSHIIIDLSSWYKTSLPPKIKLLQHAIETSHEVSFTYYAPGGESLRRIEPYLLLFQWSAWYIWGYCLTRNDYRMFKLNRMPELQCEETVFTKRTLPALPPRDDMRWSAQIHVEALFAPEMKWRLVDEFGIESFSEQADKKLMLRYDFADTQSLFSWLLSFGSQVELLSPPELKAEFIKHTQTILQKYL